MNAATEIRYPVKFAGKERRVRLEGEAYFEVVKNTEKPVYRGGERDRGEGVRNAV